MLLITRKIRYIHTHNSHTHTHTHLSIDELEECRFASSVGSDQSNPCLQVNAKVQVLIDVRGRVIIAEAHILHHDYGGRDRPTVSKFKCYNLEVKNENNDFKHSNEDNIG